MTQRARALAVLLDLRLDVRADAEREAAEGVVREGRGQRLGRARLGEERREAARVEAQVRQVETGLEEAALGDLVRGSGLGGVGPRGIDLADPVAVDLSAGVVVGQRGGAFDARRNRGEAAAVPLRDVEVLDRSTIGEVDLDEDVTDLVRAGERARSAFPDGALEEPEADERVARLGVAVLAEVDDLVAGLVARGDGIGGGKCMLDVVLVLDAGSGGPLPGADRLAVLRSAALEQMLRGGGVDGVRDELGLARGRRPGRLAS